MRSTANRSTGPSGSDASSSEIPESPVPPSLGDLSPELWSRLIHFIITSTLERGVAPTAVIALYADLDGDLDATRYADYRFTLRQIPPDWRETEEQVLDLEETAYARGVDLAAAWKRVTDVAVHAPDPLEHLARLAGVRNGTSRQPRSIFDDPEDLDALADEDENATQQAILRDRLPDLIDLRPSAQARIRRFAIEERLERGLPPIELLELYRSLEIEGDERARQYLDRVYVDHHAPPDWLDVQGEASLIAELADRRRKDAGHLYADLLRASPGLEPLVALRLLRERLER